MRLKKSNYSTWTLHRVIFNAIVLLTAVLAVISRGCGGTQRPAFVFKLAEEPLVADLDLKYRAFNAAWFNDALPKDTSIRWVYIASRTSGLTTKDNAHFTIFINPYFNRSQQQADFTLFHEMCHIETWDTANVHGPLFQSCMIERAKRGAFENLW